MQILVKMSPVQAMQPAEVTAAAGAAGAQARCSRQVAVAALHVQVQAWRMGQRASGGWRMQGLLQRRPRLLQCPAAAGLLPAGQRSFRWLWAWPSWCSRTR